MNLTFPLFRLFGIQIRIHILYPLLIAMTVLRGLDGPWGGSLLVGFYAGLMAGLLVTTLIHELGHCYGARSVGGHAEEIVLWPLGGYAYVGHGGAPRQDIKVAAMGPLMHLPLAALFGGLVLIWQPWQWSFLNPMEIWYPFAPLRDYFWANLFLGLFKLQEVLFLLNLLVPAYPLDGGRILANLLLMRFGREQAAKATTYFSVPVGVAMVAWGVQSHELQTLLIGAWVLWEAWRILKLVAAGQIEAHPMFASSPEYDYMPDRPARKGFLARWREKRTRAAVAHDREEELRTRARVDSVLEKVSRQGIGSLTSDEKRILDEASRRSRGEG